MVKKANRATKAAERAFRSKQYARKEAAMTAFLEECRACMQPDDWERHFSEASRSAGETFHLVEHFIFVLAATQKPVTPSLRRSIDVMLDTLNIDRDNSPWQDLRRLNYDTYWKGEYGYT